MCFPLYLHGVPLVSDSRRIQSSMKAFSGVRARGFLLKQCSSRSDHKRVTWQKRVDVRPYSAWEFDRGSLIRQWRFFPLERALFARGDVAQGGEAHNCGFMAALAAIADHQDGYLVRLLLEEEDDLKLVRNLFCFVLLFGPTV